MTLELAATLDLPEVKTAARAAIGKLLKDRLCSGHSYGQGSLPSAAQNARRTAAIRSIWDRLEAKGLVRLEVKPDEGCDIEELKGDMYDVMAHKDTVPGGERAIKAQEKEFERRVERDGIHGLVGAYRASKGRWVNVDSCWGMEGYHDLLDSDVADDIRWAVLEELVEIADLHRQLEKTVKELKR